MNSLYTYVAYCLVFYFIISPSTGKFKIHFGEFYNQKKDGWFIHLMKTQPKATDSCNSPSHFHIIFKMWRPGMVLLTLISGQGGEGVGVSGGDCGGINKDTPTILEISDFRFDLSTAWIAMKRSVPFSKEMFSGVNTKTSLELASFGMRLDVFTCSDSLNLSLRSRILVLILMIYLWAKKKKKVVTCNSQVLKKF